MVFYGGFLNPSYFTKILNSMVFYKYFETHGILQSFEVHDFGTCDILQGF